MQTWPSTQFFFKKWNFGNSSQKVRKIRSQNFLVGSNLPDLFTLFQVVGAGLKMLADNLVFMGNMNYWILTSYELMKILEDKKVTTGDIASMLPDILPGN